MPGPVGRGGFRGPRARESSLAAALRAGDPAARELLSAAAAPRASLAQAPPLLPARFADLPRHLVFEYYPWYETEPWRHWNQWDRRPPDDIAARYVPKLGPYDSRSRAVIERHARWIAETGAGAVNLSWWGRDSAEDRIVPLLMDVMRDHGLKVAFHLEPYAPDHGLRWGEDIPYLLREYGERRRFDALLLLRHADGTEGPVFKGFRTILPREEPCRGRLRPPPDYTPDDAYRRQFDALRAQLRGGFSRLTLLADSLDFVRAPAAGFDGIAIYDNFVPPAAYAPAAERATRAELVFSFNVNPGFDGIAPRVEDPEECAEPHPFEPPAGELDWSSEADRERAAALGQARIADSFAATLAVQRDPALANARAGFFLVYLNSFNEWHEGHAFEPAKDADELTPGERRFGYHNPACGDQRLLLLGQLLGTLREAPGSGAPPGPGPTRLAA